jgi:hypothetical protein
MRRERRETNIKGREREEEKRRGEREKREGEREILRENEFMRKLGKLKGVRI